MIKIPDEMQMRRTLFPILSIAKPNIGLRMAEIMYGTPKR
jgi:hypothetical protein